VARPIFDAKAAVMNRRSATRGSLFLLLAAVTTWACSTTTTSTSGNGSPTGAADSGTSSDSATGSPSDPTRPTWAYGNSEDESAFCELYSKAEAIVADCESSSELETSRLASCKKLTPCYREIYEPDFIERQRKCLEEKLDCSRPYTESCTELAGDTYSAGASLTALCEQRKASCKQSGEKLDLGCSSIAGLTASARDKTEACLDSSVACGDVIACMLSSYGGACADQ
jgi:hypothetical protein